MLEVAGEVLQQCAEMLVVVDYAEVDLDAVGEIDGCFGIAVS